MGMETQYTEKKMGVNMLFVIGQLQRKVQLKEEYTPHFNLSKQLTLL